MCYGAFMYSVCVVCAVCVCMVCVCMMYVLYVCVCSMHMSIQVYMPLHILAEAKAEHGVSSSVTRCPTLLRQLPVLCFRQTGWPEGPQEPLSCAGTCSCVQLFTRVLGLKSRSSCFRSQCCHPLSHPSSALCGMLCV